MSQTKGDEVFTATLVEPAVRIHQLTKNFRRLVALDRVTFDIPANSVFGLVGPNGAGKTTLFSLIAGFLKPTRGRIEVLGIDVEQVSELRGRLSILPQDALFQANVPILDQLTFFGELNGLDYDAARAEAQATLRMVGLGEVALRNPRVLSHGMSKRLGLAQAFLGAPEVVILDEPTAGLDPANARSIRRLINDLRRTGTVVISSHDLREIQDICTHVAIIDVGRLVEVTDLETFTRATRQVRMTFGRDMTEEERRALLEVAGVASLKRNPDRREYVVHLDLERTRRTQDEVMGEVLGKLLQAGLTPRSLNEGASLEARFLEVTGEDSGDRDEDYRRRDDRVRRR